MPFPTSKCGRRGLARSAGVGVPPGLRAWCPWTKEQGFAGREAPRRAGGTRVRAWGRGARRRRDKGLRGEKHHAEPPELTFGPGGVVPVDEGTRVCGERSTTPSRWDSRSCLGAWCPSTKGQGFAGREAPRRAAGTHVWAWGRGARRRRNKGLRGEKHHAEPAELAFVPGGVVPVDERTRVCGGRSTTPDRRKRHPCCPSGPYGPGPAPLRRRMASKSGAATAAPRHHSPFQ